MIDCPNAEMRDRLPDLVHETLTATARAEVTAHVAACTACAAELTLIRQLHATLHVAPTVDVSRIVGALPARRRPVAVNVPARRAGWDRLDWRVAAAVAALAVGGGSVAVWSRISDTPSRTETSAAPGPEVRVASTNVSVDADLVEASAAELDALLRDLDAFDGLPASEPEPILPAPGDTEVQP